MFGVLGLRNSWIRCFKVHGLGSKQEAVVRQLSSNDRQAQTLRDAMLLNGLQAGRFWIHSPARTELGAKATASCDGTMN